MTLLALGSALAQTATASPSPGSGAGTVTAGEAALIAAAIAAGISVVGMIVNALIQRYTLRQAAAREIASAMLEFRLRQLNDLYGPLLLRIEQSDRLARKLREGRSDPAKWRLLDHVDEVTANPEAFLVANQILDIGTEIEEILLTRAGLALHPGPPETFGLYLGHVAILRMMLREGARPHISDHEYYPRQLNDDVGNGYARIQAEINELSEAKRKEVKNSLPRRWFKSSSSD
jgi:hypothetical protein